MTPTWFAPSPPRVAVEIARRRINVVAVDGGAASRIDAYASEPLPEGLVTPALVGQNIADTGVVADALTRVLERAGLVAKDRRGREQIVRCRPEAVKAARHLLDEIEELWRGRIDRITDILAEPPSRKDDAP